MWTAEGFHHFYSLTHSGEISVNISSGRGNVFEPFPKVQNRPGYDFKTFIFLCYFLLPVRNSLGFRFTHLSKRHER